MTYSEAVHKAKCCLEQHEVPDPGIDALLLLQFVCGITRAHYYAVREDRMPEEEFDRYMELIQRRSARIPLQQLTGEQQFMGLPFHVSEDALTRRQDTEIRGLQLLTGKTEHGLCYDRFLISGIPVSAEAEIPQ